MKKYYVILLIAIMLASCKTQQLYLNVVEPAPVTLPPYIKSVGVINRSIPTDETKTLDVIGLLWEKETASSSSKIAGRACYNMAIINEINGDLNSALKWAQKSYEDYNNKLAIRYVRILENRLYKNDILKTQETR